MKQKIKIAEELVKSAENLIALDEENLEQSNLDLAWEQGKKYILQHKRGEH